ncbi:cytochrome b subunit of succinate dehydrogenase, Sdh3p [Elasticomyces elasticus]|nr:cytochrome b subunit of succinate dehydrogenase, Sdh3p [Elasticomyces elasticus]KAK3640427.1 cytochrome b subunit of succinate dehydrogenase, Sdh3p [Elasticomyces elasticus]KAK4931193.1 cytochrome b subunit of succinate dehydrogenase, Sdh3p [Elasticomyces elasticus]KAK5767876.1 cytochrome b subunit of succinate dehydrogenase, Sdh3p [Elasticomyces elasticus]
MLPQRVAQQTLRRLALQQPAYRFVAPAAFATRNAFTSQRRLAATQSMNERDAGTEILAKQRLSRPVSPHLSIYRPQITWYLSILNRITGITLSGGFYIFGAAYLVAPYVGWHLESAVLAAAFAKWPAILKIGTKALVALPFTFHSFNGIRHLFWDVGSMLTNKQDKQRRRALEKRAAGLRPATEYVAGVPSKSSNMFSVDVQPPSAGFPDFADYLRNGFQSELETQVDDQEPAVDPGNSAAPAKQASPSKSETSRKRKSGAVARGSANPSSSEAGGELSESVTVTLLGENTSARGNGEAM